MTSSKSFQECQPCFRLVSLSSCRLPSSFGVPVLISGFSQILSPPVCLGLSTSLSLRILSSPFICPLSFSMSVYLSVRLSGGSRIWVTGGGGGGRGILRPQNLWSLRDHGEGLPSPPLGGSGGMLPREILKIGMRRYAFFTILRYNFRKIRERICKVICTYIYNFYKIFEVTGKIRKIKKKMFNMK